MGRWAAGGCSKSIPLAKAASAKTHYDMRSVKDAEDPPKRARRDIGAPNSADAAADHFLRSTV